MDAINVDGFTNLGLGQITFDLPLYRTWGYCTGLQGAFPLIPTSNCKYIHSPWSQCSGITEFPLIDTSNCIRIINAWGGCTGLTDFPAINTSNCTSLQGSWASCLNLVEFPNIDTSNVTEMGYTWSNCKKLQDRHFANLSTAKVEDLEDTWNRCEGLVNFPDLKFPSLTNANGAWEDCINLNSFPPNQFDDCGEFTDESQSDLARGFVAGFYKTWFNCALEAEAIENILLSIDRIGINQPPVEYSGKLIYRTISVNGGTNAPYSTWSQATKDAAARIQARGWVIEYNT
jgi:hypothetical protein